MNLIPLTIESLVALLLMMTILYCVRLNRQLNRLRADETVMQAVIGDLTVASERAERSVDALKAAVAEADRDLGERLREAERYCADITKQTEAGSEILNRLTRIAAARANLKGDASPLPPMKPAAPDPKAIMAAAAAFTERAKAREIARDKDRAA